MLKIKRDVAANARKMLHFCDRRHIIRDIELIPLQKRGGISIKVGRAQRDSALRSSGRHSSLVCKRFLYELGAGIEK